MNRVIRKGIEKTYVCVRIEVLRAFISRLLLFRHRFLSKKDTFDADTCLFCCKLFPKEKLFFGVFHCTVC